MKKSRKISVILIAVCFMMLCGCGIKLGEEFTEEVNALEGAEFIVDADQVTPTGITYTISNQSEKDLSYGRDYSLQQEKDGKWYRIEPKSELAVTLELLWIPAGNTDTEEISWEDAYGKLPSGNYRILKNFSDNERGYYLTGEFSID